ncbi:putative F-box protein At5g55150 [Typha latifolia]|uniref:putative F-box protein At5g55150 n=1 Tax=Typha latifolia TaxID=4733 RepID=UPI003C2E9558
MLPSNSSTPMASARFFNLSEKNSYSIPQPDPPFGDRLCVGSSHGWLITADDNSELCLLNPITGDQIDLPPVTTFPFVDAVRDHEGRITSYDLQFCDEIPPESFDPDRLRYFLYEKAILSSKPVLKSPPSSSSSDSPSWEDYTVMLIHNPLYGLAFARAGDKKWTLIDTPSSYWVDAICSSNGQFFTLESKGRVEAWDLGPPLPSSTVVAPSLGYHDCNKYLVELSPGRLLQVRRMRHAAHPKSNWDPRPVYAEYTTTRIELFEWRFGMEGWVGVEWKCMKDLALFLGKNASLCVSLRDCPDLRGNSVYFTDDCLWSFEKCHEVTPDVGIFDLEDGSYKSCCACDLLWKWPPPIWITPCVN